MIFKPTKQDVAIIKAAAASESAPRISEGAVILEPAWRGNTKDESRGVSMNIALVSDDPKWNDTDLADYGVWAEFRKGIELTPDGRGIVDFYIRKRGDQYGELHGNVTIEIRNGKLAKVYGYPGVYFQSEQ